jgi:DNA-binding CsgD family transcriptional regulator
MFGTATLHLFIPAYNRFRLTVAAHHVYICNNLLESRLSVLIREGFPMESSSDSDDPAYPEIAAPISASNRTESLSAVISKLVSLFTRREIEVLIHLNSGMPLPKIADTLHIDYETVRSHKKHIMEKLGTHSTADLIRYLYTSETL